MRKLFAALFGMLAFLAMSGGARAQQAVPQPVGLFCLNAGGTAWIPSGGAAGACLGGGGGGGGAVTIADCADTALGCQNDPAWTSGAGTAIGLLKALVALGPSTSIIGWAGSTLGAITTYGTAPGAVLVPSFNGFITGAANFATAGAAVPGTASVIGTDDGTGHVVIPRALTSGTAGNPSVDYLSVQGSPTAYPLAITGSSVAVTGSYCFASASGTMAAGLTSAQPIYSFRYGGAALAIVKNVSISAQDITTGFAAGLGTFNLFAARGFTASDTGGTAATLTGNNGKLRTSFATTAVADIRISSTAALTAGTRTLDAQPLATLQQAIPVTVGYQIFGPYQAFFNAGNVALQPMQLSTNEGFVIQATVPATGTWVVTVTTCYDEVTAF